RASVSPAWTPRAMPRSPGRGAGHATGSPPGTRADVSCGRIHCDFRRDIGTDPPAGDIAALADRSGRGRSRRRTGPTQSASDLPLRQPISYCTTYSAQQNASPAKRSELEPEPEDLNMSQY